MMAARVFTCEVVYCGRRAVIGAQSSATLTALVDHLLRPLPSAHHAHAAHHAHTTHNYAKGGSERRQLVCDEEHIWMTPIRKDEGFESDTESSGSACDDPCCGAQDVKVISDHVLRLDHLLNEGRGASVAGFESPSDETSPSEVSPTDETSPSDETSSSATSSGAESEDDSPRSTSAHQPHPAHQVEDGGSGCVGEQLLMSDILYCHVSSARPRVVVVVVKDAGDSQVHAHVFQCPTDDTARTLYAHYKEASNKYKLNRYRNSKRKSDSPRGDSTCSSSSGTVVSSSSRNRTPSGSSRVYSSSSLSRTGDTSTNVKVIQVGEGQRPLGLVQRMDDNGVTHIEIDSGPGSLVSTASDSLVSTTSSSLVSTSSDTSELTSLTDASCILPSLNSGLRSESYNGGSSGPSSLVNGGREVLVAGEVEKKFRQRQPALLLRHDVSHRTAERIHDDSPRRHEDTSRWPEETYRWSEDTNRQPEDTHKWYDDSHRWPEDTHKWYNDSYRWPEDSHKWYDDTHRKNNTKRDDLWREKKKHDTRSEECGGWSQRAWHESEGGTMPGVPRQSVNATMPHPAPERKSRPRDQSRGRLHHSHNKGPAPPPPPRRHPENPALILVPTKSGAENARAFYPKESHIVRGSKVVHIELPGYRGGWVAAHDINNNSHQYTYYGNGGAWVGAHEYHALRSRESTLTPEMRRRSRSKSPARRPMAHRYIDAVTTFSLSQKLRDLSDAVFTAKRSSLGGSAAGSCGGEIKSHQRSLSSVSVAGGDDGTLRPVIKKGRRPECSPQCRRVTFSAYATVQVMDA